MGTYFLTRSPIFSGFRMPGAVLEELGKSRPKGWGHTHVQANEAKVKVVGLTLVRGVFLFKRQLWCLYCSI